LALTLEKRLTANIYLVQKYTSQWGSIQ